MFHELLQLDLRVPHDKQSYTLKKNKLVFKQTQKALEFHSICYNSEDIMEKLTYLILTAPKSSTSAEGANMNTITVTFNYNLPAQSLMFLFSSLLAIKTYKTFKLAHFQIKNGHISDYHKNTPECHLIDDMDQFEKDINTSVKLDKLWKLNKVLEYRELTKSNFDAEVGRTNRKFGKRTNQFYVLQINENLRIVVILLPRHQLVFSKVEQKEIQELYILQKHAQNLHRQNISFVTPIAQIIKNYLEQSSTNFFVSCFPQGDKTMEQVFKLPLRMSQPHEEQIRVILQGYNKNTLAQLEKELEKSKKSLKETELLVKSEEENVKLLTKTYTKLFNKTQSKINFIQNRGVTNIYSHLSWLESQIAQKEQQIRQQQAQLKQIHLQMIAEQQRHNFYLDKVKQYKDQVKSKVNTPISTPHSTGHESVFSDKENNVATEELLLFYSDPEKEVNKYREKRELQSRILLENCRERRQFFKIMEEARKKLSPEELCTFERDYYFLINS